MKNKSLSLLTAIIFVIIGLAHALRVIGGLEVNIGSFDIPVWASLIAVVIAFILAYFHIKNTK